MAIDSKRFKRGDTSFGIFYPNGYVLSVYLDDETAARAADALRDAGFATDDVLMSSGAEVVEHYAELRESPRARDRFKRFVSGLYTDELEVAGELLRLARDGQAFVAVFAPDDQLAERAAGAVRSLQPVVLRRYDKLAVTDFV
jgi:hypothetical protein